MALSGKTLLESFLTSEGFKRDQWGHYKKDIQVIPVGGTLTPAVLRVKCKKLSCRLEVKVEGTGMWVKRSHAYYKDLALTPDGRLKIGRKLLGTPREVKPTGLDAFKDCE